MWRERGRLLVEQVERLVGQGGYQGPNRRQAEPEDPARAVHKSEGRVDLELEKYPVL